MRICMTTAGALLAMTMAAQVSPDLVQVTHEGDKWYIHNLSKKVITGYVLHTGFHPLHFSATEINCAPSDWEWQPILPGVIAEIPVRQGFTPVDIPAAIFADGSVAGAAVTTEGIDVVEQIFLLRRGEAEEYARWLKILERSDHHQALADFRREAQKSQAQPGGMEESGRSGAFSSIAGEIPWLDHNPVSEEEAYQQLLAKIKGRAEISRRASIRRAQ